MKECVTHHHACDCREAKFAKLEAELAAAQRECEILGNDLADALDLKNGCGPTVLTALVRERDAAQRELSAWKDAVVEVLLECCDLEIDAPILQERIECRATLLLAELLAQEGGK